MWRVLALAAFAASVTAAPATLSAELQQEWAMLKQWSGEPGNTDTDRFTTSAASFRVSWKSEDRGRGGILDIYVRDREGKLVLASVSLQASDPTKERGSGSGTFTVNSKPGEYYLEIRSTGKDWQVAVEQPKG
jgi:hypothetical protein